MVTLVLNISVMLVLVITDIQALDMVVTTTESVRLRLLQKLPLRLKLTQLFFMVPMAMAVLDILDMLVSVITGILALDMVVITTESVRLKPLQKLPLRLKLIQLFFMVPMAMAVLVLMVMVVLVIMAMLVLDIM